jgi:hypothetical protein
MSTEQQAPAQTPVNAAMALRHRWPTAVGLLAAAFALLAGGDRDTVITVLFVALACYLAAAALGRPWVAWAAVPIGSVAVTVGKILDIEPWLVIGAASVAHHRRAAAPRVAASPQRPVARNARVRGSGDDRPGLGPRSRGGAGVAEFDRACHLGSHPLPPQHGGTSFARRVLHVLRCSARSGRHRSRSHELRLIMFFVRLPRRRVRGSRIAGLVQLVAGCVFIQGHLTNGRCLGT